MATRSTPPHLSRRSLLRSGAAATAGLTLTTTFTACGGARDNRRTQGSAGAELTSELELPEPFTVSLPIPEVLEPTRTDAHTDFYQITQHAADLEIIPGTATQVWGYNGTVPGPTLVSQRGRRTVVTHRNELPVPVVVHLHGGVTAPEHDGYPTDVIFPASSDHGDHGTHSDGAADFQHSDHLASGDTSDGEREYVYDMEQPAATLWYHDHRMDFTGPQVYRGLAGFHLIHDDAEDALGLPTGDRDIPLMIMDRAFAADGSFLYPSVDPDLVDPPGVESEYMSGVLGDCILVNGAPWPELEVSNTKYRFRILNASNARRYRLNLDGGLPFVQIGGDLGLLEAPIEHGTLDIAQAERFDVVVDFSGLDIGEEVTLHNQHGADGTDVIMRFKVTRQEEDSGPIPQRLAEVEILSEDDVVAEREFVFARGGAQAHGMTLWTVNNQAFDPDTILADPKLGTVERWRIRGLDVEHPFHIHLAPFQVIGQDRQQSVSSFNHGWKDTVSMDTGGQVDLLVRFDGYRGKYVFHCHNLEHEDMMMMANFEVV
ncbi:multicopper oxidase family protein [Kocuria sp. ZOR0020]|uniref:multicopper oxidase family protein n=1 Tax=Kocuria sp. ZOR0020 TaxID=1339234 RepID=UPI000647B7F0|nr:multicopper oxidase domain-containing protein [Kocuria sp. ZOR0020]